MAADRTDVDDETLDEIAAEGKMAAGIPPQTAKQANVVPAPPPQSPHLSGIGMSPADKLDILTVMSMPGAPCAAPVTTSARARTTPNRLRTFADMVSRIANFLSLRHKPLRSCDNSQKLEESQRFRRDRPVTE